MKIKGVPTSNSTAKLAQSVGIPIVSLDDYPRLDLDIDGADEVEPSLCLIKGGGGALLREKIVAFASKKAVIVDMVERIIVGCGGKVKTLTTAEGHCKAARGCPRGGAG